jgi:hypothetical protein
MAIDIGTGSTITATLNNAFFGATILSIEWGGIKRDSIPTSNMATTTGRTSVPSDTYDPGELQVEFQYDSTKNPLLCLAGATETVRLDFPGAGTESLAASGFMTDLSITDQFETLITARATIKLTGSITPVLS